MTKRKSDWRKKYPHLAGVFDLEGVAGMCVHRAAAFVLDVPGAEMVIATIPPAPEDQRGPNDSDVPFIHAWGEHKDAVFAPTQLERNGVRLHPKSIYYHLQQPYDIHRITRPQVLRIAKEIGLSAHLRKGVPAKASVGESFMNAAGVKWIDQGGCLLPAPAVDGKVI